MSSRKTFIASGAIAALTPVAALAQGTGPGPSPTVKPSLPKLDFDRSAFESIFAPAATHRHLFTSVSINRGEVFGAMRNTLHAYRDVGTSFDDVLLAAVLYHGMSVALGFDDAVWNEHILPLARSKHLNSTEHADFGSVIGARTRGNPCMKRSGGEWDASIPSLIANAGTHIFICNLATHGLAEAIAKQSHRTSSEIYDVLARHLVPNAMLVPSGVWAVHAVQEHRCTLLQTSL